MRTITLFTSSLLCILSLNSSAQNIQHTLVDATPLILNPAFAGNTPGKLRVIANHRFESNNSLTPYNSTNISVDAPLLTLKNGDYIGGGLYTNVYNMTKEYYGNKNQSYNASVSMHKLIKTRKSKGEKNLIEIAVGLTGGAASLYHDASFDYFTYTGYNIITTHPSPINYSITGLTNYNIDLGGSFSHSLGKLVNYTVAYSINNISTQSDAILERQAEKEGLDKRHIITLGGNIHLSKHWQLRPCFVHIKQNPTTNFIAGNELMYHLKNNKKHTSLFAGLWYRTGKMHSVNAGLCHNAWKIALAYDYNTSELNEYYNNAIELSLAYTMQPSKNGRKQMVCNRF
jgi:type IX secretion system PorP/SprF family membrane protein